MYPVLLLMMLGQCHDEPATMPNQQRQTPAKNDGIAFGTTFSLQQHDQVTLSGGEVPRLLHVSAQQLSDSRCPANVMCVQYGNATVVLEASNSQGKNEHIELCLGDCGAGNMQSTDTVTASVGATNYRFTLTEVSPFPGMEQEGDVKKAKLVVEKLN
jgi:hypothetical protein